MKKIFLSTLLMALPLLASAYDCQVDDIYYNLFPERNVAEVTYQGTDQWGYAKSDYSGSVTIPEKFTYEGVEYSVASIGDYVFRGCTKLTSVIIPNSVTNIGNGLFYGCNSLTSIKVDNENSKYDSRNSCNAIIETENNTLIAGCKKTVIPNSVTSIGELAFANCNNLVEVIIPNSVNSIGNSAFFACGKLSSVIIPNSVTSIGNSAFSGCNSLAEVIIPKSVTSIGNCAFKNCQEMTSVSIPSSVTTIGDEAFSYCLALTSVIIPNSVTKIGNSTFDNCKQLSSVSIPNSVTSIGNNAFSDCYSLTSVIIPNSVKKIGISAFYCCSNLTSLVIGNSVTNIGSYAFRYCVKLSSLTIGNSVTNIGDYAFEQCSVMTSVTIPNSVTTIGDYAFFNCSGLTSVIIPKSVTEIGYNSFGNCKKLNKVFCYAEFLPDTNINAFQNSNSQNAMLYVPEESLDNYINNAPWNLFGKILSLGDNKYSLIYIVDGIIYTTFELKEGDFITPEANPTMEGFTFSGWSDIPSTMPDHDVTVTGSFAINKYKLTYMVNGENYMSSDVEFGAVITPEAVPTKEGYTFSGWSEIPSTMPANDVTVMGTFTINKYTITYIIDGEVFKSMEVEYNSVITPPDAPAQEGYDFAWADVPETMPASDITIYGTYTTGISSLNVEEKDKQVFTPDGKRVETPKKGLNIIRMSDGTVKKVVVK